MYILITTCVMSFSRLFHGNMKFSRIYTGESSTFQHVLSERCRIQVEKFTVLTQVGVRQGPTQVTKKH